jgi:hypothetical protein
MENKIKTEHPEKLLPPHDGNLALWLSDPRAGEFFGKAFSLKLAVLAHIVTGAGTQAQIAREHRITRQAVHKHSKRAERIFFES